MSEMTVGDMSAQYMDVLKELGNIGAGNAATALAELLNSKENLTMATYEYYFAHKPERQDNFLNEQYVAAVDALTQLIEMGVEDGELFCEDARIAAEQIMYTIEGLKISLLTVELTEEEIDKQLDYLLQGLGLVQEN